MSLMVTLNRLELSRRLQALFGRPGVSNEGFALFPSKLLNNSLIRKFSRKNKKEISCINRILYKFA